MKLRGSPRARVKLLNTGLYDRMRQFRQTAMANEPSESLEKHETYSFKSARSLCREAIV